MTAGHPAEERGGGDLNPDLPDHKGASRTPHLLAVLFG